MSFRASLLMSVGAVSLATVFTMTSPLEGQPPQNQQPVKVCSPVASVVAIKVVDADGKPVSGATVRMTRVRDKESLGTALEMGKGSGQYALLESGALQWIGPDGDRVQLVIAHEKLTATQEIRVGRDKTTCRIALLSGPTSITLK